MPKIEPNNDGTFLIDGVSYLRGVYQPKYSDGAVEADRFITFVAVGRDTNETIAKSQLSNWTDENDAGFATVDDFNTYVSGFFGKAPAGGGGGAVWGSITGDINTQTDLINLVSEIFVAGNLSVSEFNGNTQLNSNATEYYGCDTILKAGEYDRFELPYKNRNTTTGTAYLYAIILDQNDATIAYKRLGVGSGGSASGSFEIVFNSPVNISSAGIYQIVLGRRNWNGSSRSVELFHKDVNSSDGRVWVAYSSSNPALDNNDTSNVDWSTISKQNFNRIPENLIYKG